MSARATLDRRPSEIKGNASRPFHIGLAQFLERNGDLGELPYLACLAQAVLVAGRGQTLTERRYLARWCRERAAAGPLGEADPGYAEGDFATALRWQAECLENPALAQRFERALPPELRRTYSQRSA